MKASLKLLLLALLISATIYTILVGKQRTTIGCEELFLKFGMKLEDIQLSEIPINYPSLGNVNVTRLEYRTGDSIFRIEKINGDILGCSVIISGNNLPPEVTNMEYYKCSNLDVYYSVEDKGKRIEVKKFLVTDESILLNYVYVNKKFRKFDEIDERGSLLERGCVRS